jgi:hypothetical protein
VGVGRAGDVQGQQRSDGRGVLALRGGVAARGAAPRPAPGGRVLLRAGGEYEFLVEDRILRMPVGSLLYVPKGNLHGHKNVGEGTGRMLVSQTPGGVHERFFEEVGEEAPERRELPVPERPEGPTRTREVAAGYGIEIPPSPEKRTQPKESK